MTVFAATLPRRIGGFVPVAIQRRIDKEKAMSEATNGPEEAVAPPAGLKIPKALGACADLYAKLRDERLAAEKVAALIGVKERYVAEHLIRNLPREGSTGIAGKVARVTRRTKTVAQVKDWAAFHAYVKKTGAFELLQRRVGEAAVQERWDAGKAVPGVEPFTVVTLSVGKV